MRNSFRNIKIAAAGIVFTVLYSMGLPLEAGLILSQDFNTDNAGVTLTPNTATADRTGAESAFTAIAGGASIYLYNNSNAGNPTAAAPFTVDNNDDPLKISFDFNSTVTAVQGNVPTFVLRDGSTLGIQLTMRNTDGTVLYHNGTTWVGFDPVLAADTWYNFQIVASGQSAVTKTFDLKVTKSDNTVVLDEKGLAFRNSIGTYTEAGWYFNVPTTTQNGIMQIDNLEIATIPEPATLGLYAITMAFLGIARRRMAL